MSLLYRKTNLAIYLICRTLLRNAAFAIKEEAASTLSIKTNEARPKPDLSTWNNVAKEKQFPSAGRNKVITKLYDGNNQKSSDGWSEE